MLFLSRLLKFWFIAVFFVVGLWFALSNQERYVVSFKPWIQHISLPAYAIVMGAFLLGALMASAAFGIDSLRKTMEIRRLKKALSEGQPSATPTARSYPTNHSNYSNHSDPSFSAGEPSL